MVHHIADILKSFLSIQFYLYCTDRALISYRFPRHQCPVQCIGSLFEECICLYKGMGYNGRGTLA